MIIQVLVKVNQNEEKIIKENNYYKVLLKNKPVNNKANNELINLLEKYFKLKVKKIIGSKSRKKTIELE